MTAQITCTVGGNDASCVVNVLQAGGGWVCSSGSLTSPRASTTETRTLSCEECGQTALPLRTSVPSAGRGARDDPPVVPSRPRV